MRRIFWAVLVSLTINFGVSMSRAEDHSEVDGWISKFSSGIRNFKTEIDRGYWWSCGRLLAEEEFQEKSEHWARAFLTRVEDYGIDPTAVGVIANESRFDECALGPAARNWAYKSRKLRPRRMGISHTKVEVIRAIEAYRKEFPRKSVDCGPFQVLWPRFTNDATLEEALSIEHGLDIGFRELQRRGRMFDTNRPWIFWPGSKPSRWYDRRISYLYARFFNLT